MKTVDNIKAFNLKNELGNIINIKEKTKTKYIPEGKYIIYDYDSELGIKLFKNNDFFLIEEWDEDTFYEITRKDELYRIDNLIEATFQEILILTNEGWTIKPYAETHLNLTSLIEKLEIYKEIKNKLEIS